MISPPKSHIGVTWPALLLITTLLAGGMGLTSFTPSHWTPVWLLSAIALEAGAVRYPGVGVFTASVGVYLAGSFFPEFGLLGILISLLLGASMRAVQKEKASTFLGDALTHWLPVLVAALVPALWKPLLGVEPHLIAYVMTLVVYFFVEEFVSRKFVFEHLRGETRISWMRLRRSVMDIRTGVAVAGAILLLATPEYRWLPLALAPVLWTTHQGMKNAIFRVGALLTAEMEKQADRLRGDLESTRDVLEHTQQARADLQEEVSKLSVVLHSARVLGTELEAKRLIKLAEGLATEQFEAKSGVIIWADLKYHWGPAGPGPLMEGRLPNTFACRLPREGKDFGYLYFQCAGDVARDPEHARLLETFAYSLGLALENATRYKQVVEVQQQLVEGSKLRAIGQLAAGVAHELNSPLGAIRLALEALATQDLNERGQKRIGRALSACGRALDIVQKLLVYSREKKSSPKPVSARHVVEDTLLFLRSDLQTGGCRLDTEVSTDAQVVGVSGEIQQVLINLVLNAVQACEGKEEERRTVLISCSAGDGVVDFLVADRGDGVPNELAERIFEPFFTTKEVGQGTGLGLSISREIAETHGGSLTLLPSREGARFLLRLPRHT